MVKGTAHPEMAQQGGSRENHTPTLLHLPSCISCRCPSLAKARGGRSTNVQPTEFSIPSRQQGLRKCGADPERYVHNGQSCRQVTPVFFPSSCCSGQYLGNRGKLSIVDESFPTTVNIYSPLATGPLGSRCVKSSGHAPALGRLSGLWLAAVSGSPGLRQVGFYLMSGDPKVNHSPCQACYCLGPT